MTALVGLHLPLSEVTTTGSGASASRLGALLPHLPRDALSLSLLTVVTALLVLALTLRRALPSGPHHSKQGLLSSPSLPSSTTAWLWLRGALVRLVDILEGDDEDGASSPEHLKRTPSPKNDSDKALRTFTLDGTQYRLPAAPPKGLHRPKQRGVPLASPPAPSLSFVPPTPPVRVEMPRRPLSAAKLIMSRHSVRKPYRPPPVPGAPRSTPCSRLAAADEVEES